MDMTLRLLPEACAGSPLAYLDWNCIRYHLPFDTPRLLCFVPVVLQVGLS